MRANRQLHFHAIIEADTINFRYKMNITSKLSAVFILALAALSAKAQSITNFGSDVQIDGLTSTTWNASTSVLGGLEGAGDLIWGTALNTNFTGATMFTITATATTAPLGGFTFTLADNANKIASASFNWVDFAGGGVKTVSSIITFADGFNTSSVTGPWNLAGGSSGTAINVQLISASASAVPEPATYAALFGAAALGLAVVRRRRQAA